MNHSFIEAQPSYHCRVKFLGPTNTKGARVKLIFDRHQKSITIPYNYEFSLIADIAIDYLRKHKIECEYKINIKEYSILIIDRIYLHQINELLEP